MSFYRFSGFELNVQQYSNYAHDYMADLVRVVSEKVLFVCVYY